MATSGNAFAPLALLSLHPGAGLAHPGYYSPNPVKASSPALDVMTDLHQVPAATIPARIDIETATQKMIARGVRLLLVLNDDDHVAGLVTARDIAGDRPTEIMTRMGISPDRVKVEQVMTPADQVEVMTYAEVAAARVGDITATLKNSWRQHALVVEQDGDTGRQVIRGVFSASQIARQLGISPQFLELSETFAEIDRAISVQR